MKKLVSLTAVAFLSFAVFTNCSEQKSHEEHADSEKGEMHQSHEAHETAESPLVRTGTIDLASIDKNEDGKLFECPMDWNVISDDKGECPVCGMHLKEYTQTDVAANLDKYGFEHK